MFDSGDGLGFGVLQIELVIGNYGNGKCTKVKYMVSDTYLLCELDFVCITNVLGESLMRWL